MAGHLRVLTVPALRKHTASIIFLHGSGDNGEGIKEWVDSVLDKKLEFNHIKVIFPSAPTRLYTPTKAVQSVWFDRIQISPFCSEDLASIDQMCSNVSDIIKAEVDSGIPENRIIIGGFSMGGALSFHCAYRFHQNVAGVFAMSSFLNENSAVYEELSKVSSSKQLPGLYQTHGGRDELVLLDWAKTTNDGLYNLGVKTSLRIYPNLYHQFNAKILNELVEWILKLLPE